MCCIIANTGIAEEKRGKQEIVIKNPTGNKFRALWKYPGRIQPSVRFSFVPRAIGINSKGDIYVGGSVNYRVMKFTRAGDYVLEFKLQPPV